MLLPALRDRIGEEEVERERIAIPTQLHFLMVIVTYWIVFSFIGGAALARYMLPAIRWYHHRCLDLASPRSLLGGGDRAGVRDVRGRTVHQSAFTPSRLRTIWRTQDYVKVHQHGRRRT